jgi:hypothetical protein
MHNEWRTLERRPGKEHGLPEIVHPRQMRRPVHMRDVVENGSEDVVVSHAIVEEVDEARHIPRISDVEPRLIHFELHIDREISENHMSLRLSKQTTSTGGSVATCARARKFYFREPMIEGSRARCMRDGRTMVQAFRLRAIMKQGTAASLPETWTHYPSVESARAGAKLMYRNDRVLRVMMVTDSAGSFVEWIER